MKYFAMRLCALFAFACFLSPARTQSKVEEIDFQQLISAMSESSAASAQVESLRQPLNGQIMSLSNQLESKTVTLQEDKSPLDDPSKLAKETGIKALTKQLREMQASAQQTVQSKVIKITAAVMEKTKSAVNRTATEGGYTLMLKLSQGEVLYSVG